MPITTSVATSCATTPGLATQVLHRGGFKRKRAPYTGALGKGGTYAGWHRRFSPPCVKGACRRSRLGDCFLTTPPLQQVAPPPQGLLRNPRTGEALGKRGSVIQGNLVKKEVSLYRWPSLVRFIFPWCFICIY